MECIFSTAFVALYGPLAERVHLPNYGLRMRTRALGIMTCGIAYKKKSVRLPQRPATAGSPVRCALTTNLLVGVYLFDLSRQIGQVRGA